MIWLPKQGLRRESDWSAMVRNDDPDLQQNILVDRMKSCPVNGFAKGVDHDSHTNSQ